jgi:hypothetical protein
MGKNVAKLVRWYTSEGDAFEGRSLLSLRWLLSLGVDAGYAIYI